MSDSVHELTDLIDASADGLLMFVTGAGVSAASGLKTFRGVDPEAIWNESDINTATRAFLQRDPVTHWRWYLQRFERIDQVKPNAAHRALVDLERRRRESTGEFLLVTQNIDTLHEQAGSQALVKVHGSSDRVRCTRAGCEQAEPSGSFPRESIDLRPFISEPCLDNLPRCPDCDGLLRAHVLFFDEMYHDHVDYQFSRVQTAVEQMRAVVFVGTSFSVGITDLILHAALSRRVPALAIDARARDSRLPFGLRWVQGRAESLLPQAVRSLD